MSWASSCSFPSPLFSQPTHAHITFLCAGQHLPTIRQATPSHHTLSITTLTPQCTYFRIVRTRSDAMSASVPSGHGDGMNQFIDPALLTLDEGNSPLHPTHNGLMQDSDTKLQRYPRRPSWAPMTGFTSRTAARPVLHPSSTQLPHHRASLTPEALPEAPMTSAMCHRTPQALQPLTACTTLQPPGSMGLMEWRLSRGTWEIPCHPMR